MPPNFKKRLAETAVNETTTIEHRVESYYNKPTLLLAPLSGENRPFLSHVLRREAKEAEKPAALRTVEDAAADHQEAAQVIARFSVRGWTGLYDDEDNEVTFSSENALAFLAALAETHPHEIMKMGGRARDLANYEKSPSMRPEAVAKNS